MVISREVEEMCVVKQGVHHGAAPIPEEAKWVQAKEVKDISGFTHGVGWCAPQQEMCIRDRHVIGCLRHTIAKPSSAPTIGNASSLRRDVYNRFFSTV